MRTRHAAGPGGCQSRRTCPGGRGWSYAKPRKRQHRGFPSVQPRPPEAPALDSGLSTLDSPPKAAFTLVELLVVMSIMLILIAMTIAAVNVTMQGDRIRSAARQVQSYLEGARDRAIHADEPRGIRFLVDSNVNTVSTSMIFIGAPTLYSEGTVSILNDPSNTNDHKRRLTQWGPLWGSLRSRGLLASGARIKVPKDDGRWYTIHWNGSTWRLTTDYQASVFVGQNYLLELAPAVLPNQEPRLLPGRIAIDLDHSRIPAGWNSGGTYSNRMDIMFSPRGTVTGEAAVIGLIHLVLTEAADAEIGISPLPTNWASLTSYAQGATVLSGTANGKVYLATNAGTSGNGPVTWPTQAGDTVTDSGITWQCHDQHESLIVTVTTRTGSIASHPIYQADPSDPFFYAETGEEAK